MKYLLVDVSGTILHKPTLFDKIHNVLSDFGYKIEKEKLQYNHKILSETIKFPDRTDADFYTYFNGELLYSLGIIPTTELVSTIFKACSYLPWEKYEDTSILKEISVPIGILSNFNTTLEAKLNQFFGPIFEDVFVSEIIGKSKPSLDFYKYALDKIDIEPKEILYIGDSFKLDFEPANSLGISTFIIDREGFYKNNSNVIRSLSQINEQLNQ